ncbi:MAG: hypothetical protein BGO76_00705 [Caedibacter sp. 38-128]|mgnify:CR=1 FL=1|nr:MFS transporter [Holosporales bacterium]OJX05171.1 MAG: hypothetical protein BGO76_00705 [Caedibacter sp. 38-128]
MEQSVEKYSVFALPKSIWSIGLVTLLVNLSSVIIFSLSPIYLTTILGVSTFNLGILEGVVEATSLFTRIFSGVLSDYLYRRKPILIFAYALSALSRPIFAIATSLGWIAGARIIDRVSNGLQATPREALVGDLAPKSLKGACFGLRQTLSMVGSFAGAGIVMFLMHHTNENYQIIFWVAAVPPILAVLALIFFVQDSPIAERHHAKISFWAHLRHTRHLNKQYWRVVFVAGIFMFSNYSGAYMILQGTNQGLSPSQVPILMVLQNLFAFASAYPMGRLSDRFDRRILIGVGFIITMISNAFFAMAHEPTFVLIGASLWGLQMGMTQSLLLTKVADTTFTEIRGTGFGIYYLIVGVTIFLSNTLTGWIFTHKSPSAAFWLSACVAGIALLFLPFLESSQKAKR